MGPDKTGSTAIQRFFTANAKSFAESGVIYSTQGKHNDRDLAIAYCETAKRAEFFFNAKPKQWSARKEYLQQLEKIVQSCSADTLVLSHEGLVHLNENEMNELYRFLQTLGERVEVILYARAPESYAISAMSQRVKTGRRAFSLMSPPVLLHRHFIKRIISVFGREHVQVRPFDKKQFPSGDVSLDFLCIPALNPLQKLEDYVFIDNFEGNPSFSNIGIKVADKIVSILGDEVPLRNDFKSLFASDLYQLKGDKAQLSRLQLWIVQLKAARHIQYLHQEFDIVFPKFTFNKINNEGSNWALELLARDLIERHIPQYQLSKKRALWRQFICRTSDHVAKFFH